MEVQIVKIIKYAHESAVMEKVKIAFDTFKVNR